MKKAGFRKSGSYWYFENGETICVLNLQKSSFGDQYYVNLGVLFKELSNDRSPKVPHLPIRFRLDDIYPDQQELKECFNFESQTTSESEKTDLISRAINGVALPALEALKNISEIKRAFEAGNFKTFAVTGIAIEFLTNFEPEKTTL